MKSHNSRSSTPQCCYSWLDGDVLYRLGQSGGMCWTVSLKNSLVDLIQQLHAEHAVPLVIYKGSIAWCYDPFLLPII